MIKLTFSNILSSYMRTAIMNILADEGDDVMINGYFAALAISNRLYQPSPESFCIAMMRMKYMFGFP